ncbi:MAG: hypothetical protein U0L09_03165, partial [Christensenellales bacterium]|nr:hypothetical protein [Christensenellales bacterium]
MEQSLSKIRGIGPARVMALNRAGIYSPRDLVMNLPKDYRDTTQITPVGLIRAGETVAVRARVCGDARQQRAGKLLITKVFVTDGEDVLLVVWYNQPWLKNQLSLDRELLLYGKAEWKRNALQLTSPVIEQELGLIPVYRTVAGISEKVMRATVEAVLEACDAAWPEELPQAIRRRFGLCERNFALRNAHFPGSHEALTEARRRLAFEELLLFQVAVMLQRSTGRKGVRFTFRDEFAEDFWNRLPFVPTNAQRRVLKEIEDDLKSEYAMARLVQGDV